MSELLTKTRKTRAVIYRPEDVKEKMYFNYRNGIPKGTTTYNEWIDNAWKWRKKESNIWTGYANEGKSIFLKQLCMIKALNEGWRFAFSAPEDFPPEEFYDDMVHTLTGCSTDKDSIHYVSEEFYDMAYELIKNYFVFVYIAPPKNTIKEVLDEIKYIANYEKIDGVVIDPLLKFAWPEGHPDNYERYASYIGSLFVDFCRVVDVSAHLVMHQNTPTFDEVVVPSGDKKKRYSEPSMYRVKGGGSWADGFDNVLSIWRPNYAFDKADTTVQFSSQKIKKQKLVGVPQKINFTFDRKSNRYFEADANIPIFDFDKFVYDN